MTDNVLPFSGTYRARPEGALEDHQKVLRARQTAVVSAVREAAAKNMKLKLTDVKSPARVVEDLVRDAKQQKITQGEICAELKRRNLPARLDRMMGQAQSANKFEAQRKVAPYLAVIEFCARRVGKSPDDLIYDAFFETEIATGVRSPAEDDPARELSLLIREITEAIIRKEDLQEYFAHARKTNGAYDLLTGRIVSGNSALIFNGGLEDGVEIYWAAPPLPAVELFRVRAATFSGPLWVERAAIAPPDCPPGEVGLRPWQDTPQPLGAFDVIDAEITLYTDIRLVIGPMQRPDDLGPLFETRSFVELRVVPDPIPTTHPFSLTPITAPRSFETGDYDPEGELADLVGSVAGQFPGGWKRITGFGSDGWSGDFELSEHIGVTMDWGVQYEAPVVGHRCEFAANWSPVNAKAVADMEKEASSINWAPLFSPEDGFRTVPSELRCQEAARALERAVFSGAIEHSLVEDCRRLKDQLRHRMEDGKAVRAAALEALRSDWRERYADCPPETSDPGYNF